MDEPPSTRPEQASARGRTRSTALRRSAALLLLVALLLAAIATTAGKPDDQTAPDARAVATGGTATTEPEKAAATASRQPTAPRTLAEESSVAGPATASTDRGGIATETTAAASTESTTAPSLAADPAPVPDQTLLADVFIWDTTTQGIASIRAMQLARSSPALRGTPVQQLVIASTAPKPTAMPAQGLAVEDIYTWGGDPLVSGFWAEFRRGVLADYRSQGINALDSSGRLVVEPEVAARHLRWYIDRNGEGRANSTFLCAHLLSATYQTSVPGRHEVMLRTADGRVVRVLAKTLIDASVEGDLALRMGARYRFGLGEGVFGPTTGPPPRPTGSVTETWIQRTSALLTLKVTSGTAPRVADLRPPVYDPAGYGSEDRLRDRELSAFATSWSMSHVLPNGKRELNETWSDYPLDIALPHTYVFGYQADPLVRLRLRNLVLQYTLDRVRYLQETGYPRVGVASIPSRLYLREGPRVVGISTYTSDDIRRGRITQPVVFGRYALYDVHLWITQDHDGAFVFLPYGSLLSADFPDLLIPGPISADHQAYNSAVRMEPVRAGAGGAAGIVATLALARGVPPGLVPYDAVRSELLRQGYRLGR